MPPKALFSAALFVSLSIGLSGSPARTEPAILFIPEFCSASSSFSEMLRQLPSRRFGDELVAITMGADGIARTADRRAGADAISFAIDFRAPDGAATASRISIRDKAGELKSAIEFVKATTGSSRVVLVGHGMGGLVARAYVQGLGINPDSAAIAYDDDVAGVITIDAPHRGATASGMPSEWDSACASSDSTNWREMTSTGPGTLLDSLNRAGWPAGLRLDSITSFYSDRPGLDTDGVVQRESQDARAISDYWATNADVRAWPQPLAGRRLDGFPRLAAHSAVIRTTTTSALVNSLVEELDRTLAVVGAQPFETQGLPESQHDYSPLTNSSWSYTLAGNPGSIDVMFDPRTYVEEDYDYIYVMDGAGNNISGSPFTADLLAGRTVRVTGSTVRIRLTSDDSVNYFGFKLASVNAASGGTPSSPIPESSHPYTDNFYGGWFYTLSGSPSAINVVFDSRTKTEADYDYIHVTDAEGREVGGSPFTGTTLAGKTIRVQGDSVRVVLESDESGTDFGFKVTSVTAVTGATASVSTSGYSATTERTSTGVTYHTTFTLCETGGRSAITLATIRVNLRNSTRSGGATFDTSNGLTPTLNAGACRTYQLAVSSTNATDPYTSVTFVITYSDSTGVQSSYATPTSTSITPPGGTTAPPTTTSGTKYDGTYNFFFRNPGPGGTTESHNAPNLLTIRNGQVNSNDGSVRGTVDLTFGNITFTGPCPINNSVATFTGIMNQSALAGSNFGQGNWQCSLAIGGTEAQRSWQATQSR
jgi:pimeloyl-ACP methyl ester carboxylesterase